MKFLLLEKVPRITNDEKKRYETSSDRIRTQMESDIIKRYEHPSAFNMMNPLRKSFRLFGIDPKKNPFIEFTDKLINKVPMKKTQDKLLNILVDMYRRRDVNLNHDYLLQPELYSRTPEEFQYTVNVFEITSDPSKLSKYFQDTSKISIEDLYSGGQIKPAGNESTADDTNTLFGTVESWSGEGSQNDKAPDVKAVSKTKLGKGVLQSIKKQYRYGYRDEIKNPEIGLRVYVDAISREGTDASNYGSNAVGAGYYEWDGAKWIKLAGVDY